MSEAVDPRAANCRAFALQDNLVTSVELVYLAQPQTKYAITHVELIDERQAQGNTVAKYEVRNAAGDALATPVYLAWPFPNLEKYALAGNANNEHVIESEYAPPTIGPLALLLRDASGQIISDVIGGLGLPFRHHISFSVSFRERGSAIPPTGGEPPTNDAVIARLAVLDVKLSALAKHLGLDV